MIGRVDLENLRAIWLELKLAKRSICQAQQYKTDFAVLHGATGFVIEHLEKAMRMVEQLGRDEIEKRIRRNKALIYKK